MIVLYWISAVAISLLAGFLTSLAVTLLINTLRSDKLDASTGKFWNWCVNGIITLSYLAIPFYSPSEESSPAKIKTWGDLWISLKRLSEIEAKWFIYLVVFWFVIILLVHRAGFNSE